MVGNEMVPACEGRKPERKGTLVKIRWHENTRTPCLNSGQSVEGGIVGGS